MSEWDYSDIRERDELIRLLRKENKELRDELRRYKHRMIDKLSNKRRAKNAE